MLAEILRLQSKLEDNRDETDHGLQRTETEEVKAPGFVKESAPQCRKKVKETLIPLRQLQAEITAAVFTVQTAKKEVAENHATVSNTINQSIDQLIAILQQRKKDLLAKASELAEEKLGALNAQEISLNRSLTEAQTMLDFVEQSLENATDEDILHMKQHVVNGVETCCKKQQQVDLQPAAKANIGTDMSCDPQALHTVGSVGLDVIDLTKCEAELEGKEIEINKPAQFTLHLMDSTGYSYIGLSSIVAEVKSHVDGSVIPAAITPVQNGTYSVTFTPQVRGHHYITVRVNGREMNPFSVFVRIPPAQLQLQVRRVKVKKSCGIAIGNNDIVLVTEHNDKSVSIFDKRGRKLRTIQHKDFPQPFGVTTDPDGNIYTTHGGNSVVKCDRDGHIEMTVRSVSDIDDDLRFIRVISDRLYVCCARSNRILVYGCSSLQLIESFGETGDKDGEFNWPYDVLSANGELYVSDCNNHRIQVFDQEGLNFVRSFKVKNTSTQELCKPRGICVGPDGLLYVACHEANCVLTFTLSGRFLVSVAIFDEYKPRGIAVDSDGFVYVSQCATAVSVL